MSYESGTRGGVEGDEVSRAGLVAVQRISGVPTTRQLSRIITACSLITHDNRTKFQLIEFHCEKLLFGV